MGEIIRKIEKIRIGGSEFDIELNKSTASKDKREIHVQNEKFRLALDEKEFVQMACAVLLAKKQFDILKGRKQE